MNFIYHLNLLFQFIFLIILKKMLFKLNDCLIPIYLKFNFLIQILIIKTVKIYVHFPLL